MKLSALLAAAAVSFTAAASVSGPDGGEWQDNQRLSLGTEPQRAAFSSFDSEADALKILPEHSPRQLSLDSESEWKFHWARNPAERAKDFWREDFDVSSWPSIRVPCSWQAMGADGKGGWGTPLYVNIKYPFQPDAPGGSRVMLEPPQEYTSYAERNPVGSYRRDFVLPEGWLGKGELFLKFDGVDSFYYLWVNGKYVGFTKDSRSPAEFNVTRFLREGRNTVALEVYRYSDGSYLEDQDMFRLSGIFRRTWLLLRPVNRIRDFFVTARPVTAQDYAGDWKVDVEVEGKVDISLYTFDGRLVRKGPEKTFVVKSPALWSAEIPNCYKVVIGNGEEYVSAVFGFRVSEIRDGRYFLNGCKIKLKGANRHETHPMWGHYVPAETHELDVKELKAANCNAVRNAHYPQDDYWYYLCNVHGIYLCDEANVESHGYGYGTNSLSHFESWRKATVGRNMAMVERNKNHPSVVIWSYGNEAGPGENFQAVEKAIKARDTTRVTHYERDWSVADMEARQYPTVEWMWNKARDVKAKKPFYVSEYAHNMGNAMGNLQDYQDAIESTDVLLGATIWDWVDQGLYMDRDGKRMIAYGGDFGDFPTDGSFVMNGCVLSDRTREPGFYEIKHVYRNWTAKATNDFSQVVVRNKNYFRTSEGVVCRWTVIADGDPFAGGEYDLHSLAPQSEHVYDVPAAVKEARGRSRTVSLRISFADASGVVADDQIDFPEPAAGVYESVSDGAIAVTEDGDSLVLSVKGVEYAFSRKSALLSGIRTGRFVKSRWLAAPMRFDAFRAPSLNEVRDGESWMRQGLHEFEYVDARIGKVEVGSSVARFTSSVRAVPTDSVKLENYRNAVTKTVDTGKKGDGPSFDITIDWTLFADGTLGCSCRMVPDRKSVELARIGFNFTLDRDDPTVDYFAAGPFENYRDRMSGAFLGRYRAGADDFFFPYARPQDCGNRENARSVTFESFFDTLGFAAVGKPFAFQVNPYSPLELVAANHPPQLPVSKKCEFGIFAETRGLGGASCGPPPMKRDIVATGGEHVLEFVVGPRRYPNAVALPAGK